MQLFKSIDCTSGRPSGNGQGMLYLLETKIILALHGQKEFKRIPAT